MGKGFTQAMSSLANGALGLGDGFTGFFYLPDEDLRPLAGKMAIQVGIEFGLTLYSEDVLYASAAADLLIVDLVGARNGLIARHFVRAILRYNHRQVRSGSLGERDQGAQAHER